MNRSKKLAFALATCVSALFAASSASAQNSFFQDGDLIMGFQLKQGNGSDQTILVNLGNTASLRDATSTVSNIANVGALLDQTFGLSAGNATAWYDNTNLYFGAVGVWSNANPPDALQNGDPQQSIYVTKSRTAVGDITVKNSTIATPSSSNQTAASNLIMALNSTFETQLTTGAGTVATSVANTWEDYNVTSTGGVQSTAFAAYTGGIQQRFAAGSYGTVDGNAVEGALDLYRSQQANNIDGQYGAGDALRVGQFQGILTINQNGQVDFVVAAVPEPSSALLVGGIAFLGMLNRRRRAILA